MSRLATIRVATTRIARSRRALAVAVGVGTIAAVVGPASPAAAAETRITAYFPSAISLYPNSSVKILGLGAGNVTAVEPEGDRVRVELTVRSGIPLPVDVRATIVPSSLIGERYVQLGPAWTDGEPKAAQRIEIPIEHTSVPVEPDAALAALKRLLDSLDPNATGRLVKNLAIDLDGNGQTLSKALRGISQLTTTLADKDDAIAGIIDNVDKLTGTLRTRESQLSVLLDSFAKTANILATERQEIATLVKGLADVTGQTYDLVAQNRVQLQKDLAILTRLLESVSANLDSVRTLLSTAPVLVAGPGLTGVNEGVLAAVDPLHHSVDLRNAFSPMAAGLVGDLLGALGLPTRTICLPVDVSCSGGISLSSTKAPGAPAAATATTPATTAAAAATSALAPTTPIDDVLGLLGAPTAAASGTRPGLGRVVATSAADPAPSSRGMVGRLRRSARHLVEALS